MKNLPTWVKGLAAAFIGGAANAGGNYFALATAKGLGMTVPDLNWKTLGILSLWGGVIAVYAYFKSSPLPTTETATLSVTKEVTKG